MLRQEWERTTSDAKFRGATSNPPESQVRRTGLHDGIQNRRTAGRAGHLLSTWLPNFPPITTRISIRRSSIIQAAKDSGADAVKLQTYTAETITIHATASSSVSAAARSGTAALSIELYSEAYTPWEWQPKLKQVANDLGMDLFSSPFDDSAVDFLEKMNVPAHKVASFELVDIGLIQKMARTGKPLIMSTGMATSRGD